MRVAFVEGMAKCSGVIQGLSEASCGEVIRYGARHCIMSLSIFRTSLRSSSPAHFGVADVALRLQLSVGDRQHAVERSVAVELNLERLLLNGAERCRVIEKPRSVGNGLMSAR